MIALRKKCLMVMGALLTIVCSQAMSSRDLQGGQKQQVPVIRNPKKTIAKELIKISKDLVIGSNKDGAEDFFEELQSVLADDKGNIYVLDGRAEIVKVFDSSGKLISTVGKKGQGPGEYERPSGMQFTSNKELLIRSIGRLSYFTLDGKYLRQFSKMTWDVSPIPDRKGRFIGLSFSPTTERGVFNNQLMIFSEDYSPLKEIAGYKGQMRADTEMQPIFPKRILYAMLKNGNIVWGINQSYVLNITDEEGSLLRQFTREYDPIAISDEEKKATLARMNRLAPGGNWEFPENYPPMYNIITDDENHIIIQTYEHFRSPYRKYEIFSVDGKYVADFVLKNNLAYWKNNKIYCITETGEGIPQLERYSVIWGK